MIRTKQHYVISFIDGIHGDFRQCVVKSQMKIKGVTEKNMKIKGLKYYHPWTEC